MLSRVRSAAVMGVDAYLVEVEVDLANGLPSFTTVGLPQGAVREGKERVTGALVNSGFEFPLKRLTINLAPADIAKSGSGFDLPIALGILGASGQVASGSLEGLVFLGELGLDGNVRPVRGALSMALAARAAGARGLILPTENVAEAAVVDRLPVFGAGTLLAATRHLSGAVALERGALGSGLRVPEPAGEGPDLAEVRGQQVAKRALEIAAAGGHNLLMIGAPGAGKTMLARRLPSILPRPSLEEALEITKVHSVAGLLPSGTALLAARPFRAPHHTISDAGLVGGGSTPRPGEVSLAHGGVLFLDELPEFQRHVLEVLRQPLEDGVVTLSRAASQVTFPARFTLVAAMNPCPCGHLGSPVHTCRCGPLIVERYRRRISGPLLDRIDMHLSIPAVPYHELAAGPLPETSREVRVRVEAARAVQQQRFAGRPGLHANAHMSAREVRRYCGQGGEVGEVLRLAVERVGLTARGCTRVLKVARTIADLAGAPDIAALHVREAIQYRAPTTGQASIL